MEEKVTTVEELRELKKGIMLPAEVAEFLGVSVATLGKWRWKGRYHLPSFKLGRKVMYRASDVAAFLEGKLKPEAVRNRRHQTRKAA